MPKKIAITDEAIYQLHIGGDGRSGQSYSQLGQILGLTRGQIAGRIHRHKQTIEENGVKPQSDLFDVEMPSNPELEGDWIVTGDIHVPTTDYEFAQLPAAIGKKYGVKNLLVAGDTYNMDVFSKYPARVGMPTWKQEKKAAIQLFSEWVRVFDRIVIRMGNHDYRLGRALNGAVDHEEVFGHLLGSGKVETGEFAWATINTPSGKWRATHPKNYSINQLVVADTLAQKYQMHIIGHHEHHLAIGWDRYKHYVIINNGGLFDVNKMAYVQLEDSKSAGMAKGFTMLRDGVPYVFGEYPYTDWNFWL